MRYTRKVTDYETGEVLTLEIGEYLTLKETADEFRVSRSTLTKAMLKIGLCQVEYDEVAGKNRNRLHPDAVEKGLGYRIIASYGPFDVLSPLGREVAKDGLDKFLISRSPERWRPVFEALKEFEETRKENMLEKLSSQMRVDWLFYHYGELPIHVLAEGIGVSKRLVYRHVNIRNSQLEKSKKLRESYHRNNTQNTSHSDKLAA